MKRLFLFMLLVMLLASGCQSNNVATLAAAQSPQAPTETVKPAAATATPKASVQDSFDSSSNWLQAITVTTQALAGKEQSMVQVKDKALDFDLKDKETFMYTFFKDSQKADVAAEVKYQSIGAADNGIALICRAKADYSTWYEVRVGLDGIYNIYKYDKSLKQTGENPYVRIKTGKAPKNTILPVEVNSIKFICKGQDLTLDINGGKFSATEKNADLTGDGLVGVGAMSLDTVPVHFKVTSFAISQP
jgi:hypothetical protein